MPSVYLHISDNPLRAALVEQLKSLAGYQIVEPSDFAPNADIYVIDSLAANKKTFKILRDLKKDNKRALVFLLGEDDGTESDLLTESFRYPLRLGHLLVRVHYHSEVAHKFRNTPLIFGPYRLEPYTRQIVVSPDNTIIRLTEKETALLEYLGQNDQPIGRDELLVAIWGYDSTIETHTLETHIYQLRRKLDPDNTGENWLLNEQGAYRLRRVMDK